MNQFEVTDSDIYKDNLIKNTISAAVENLSSIELCLESKNELKSKLYELTKTMTINNNNEHFSTLPNPTSKNSARKINNKDQTKIKIKRKNFNDKKSSKDIHQTNEIIPKVLKNPYVIKNSKSLGKIGIKETSDCYIPPYIDHGTVNTKFIKETKKRSSMKGNNSPYKFYLVTSKELGVI